MSSATALFATLKCSAYQCNLRQDQHWVNRESGICYCDECQSAEHVTPAHNRTQYCLIVSCHPSPSSLSPKINAAWIVIIQTESRHVVLLVPRQSKAITWRVWDGDFRNITNDSRIQWKGGGWFCSYFQAQQNWRNSWRLSSRTSVIFTQAFCSKKSVPHPSQPSHYARNKQWTPDTGSSKPIRG